MKNFIGVAIVAFLLTACNTIEGVGEDIERGGEHIQDASENVKERL